MLKPLYMWAGGKTKLMKHYAPILPLVSDYDFYAEPFFGGGALYGNIAQDFKGSLIIGDVNEELMGLMEKIRENSASFTDHARNHVALILSNPDKESRKRAYYSLRSS